MMGFTEKSQPYGGGTEAVIMEKTRLFTFAGRVLKNLFQKPATVQYPFAPAKYPERMRGHVGIVIEDCISCGTVCESVPVAGH